RSIVNRNIGYPDGIGAVLGLKRKGVGGVQKIPGCELWLDIIRRTFQEKSFYVVGGREEVITAAVSRLRHEFPGIAILGFRDGYLSSEAERAELVADIATKAPDIVFVAMGSPLQEILMEEMFRAHPAVYQGLGGSLDVYTGRVPRAPRWWVDHNLEWLFRLVREPSRAKRQIQLARFLARLCIGRI